MDTPTDLLSPLNPAQRDAVTTINGPVLVLAGPGSGKTRVLTYRVAYLLRECRIAPYNILAVTFTNKAAREMRERLTQLVGEASVHDLTIGTFHATCARWLRREGERVGLTRGFVIYDEDDQESLIKQVLAELNLSEQKYRPGTVLNAISKAKNELISPEEYTPPSYWHEVVGRVYKRYQQLLLENNAADFDDLIMLTVQLFRENPDVLERYQNRYRYLHVDEFQDTNVAQYVLLKLLANKHQNLFCVGDEDQSVYSWRGADYRNVLRFSRDFPNAQVKLLEQNYRSTQTILDVAQAIIRKNRSRHAKQLWTENARGIPITVYEAYDQEEEARFVVNEIAQLMKQGYAGREIAVFYRTNAQSRALEDAFLKRGMPYQLIGATRFYQRREIKDLLAYLRLIHNPNDSVAFQRIINVPPRGIGKTTLDTLMRRAERLHVSPYAVLQMLAADEEDEGRKTKDKGRKQEVFDTRARHALLSFVTVVEELRAACAKETLPKLFDRVLRVTAYKEYLRDGSEEGEERWENVRELRSVTTRYADANADVTLAPFLEEVALIADIDTLREDVNAPTLMTLHTAKGLEFRVVFIVGLEEGLLPHARSMDNPDQMEEERRLCYVGITRAKERVYLTHAFQRARYGMAEPSEPSRYLKDIPRQLIQRATATPARVGTHRAAFADDAFADEEEDLPPAAVKTPQPRFRAGDRVHHTKFGEGVVISSQMMGDDEEVRVAFVNQGVKRLSARVSGLKKK
jgi:DNA helicase-2/ATP-dependent DNA helicase PcrA